MFRIERVRIEIMTDKGVYGADEKLYSGLNFLSSSHNTCGKSSILEAIYYGLGFEEIIGGRGEKVLTSVYKTEIQTNEGNLSVLESRIYLQLFNGDEHITVFRTAKCQNRESNLITVYHNIIDKIKDTCHIEDKYVHLSNSATSENGFHYFLEYFIKTSLPCVPANDGTRRKLYLQLLFSSMFIEQKHGWSDLFSGTPILGIKDAKKRIVEFILNLDTLERERKKEEIKAKEKDITSRWNELKGEINISCKVENCDLINILHKPQLLTTTDIDSIHIVKNGLSINEYIDGIAQKINELCITKPKIIDNFEELQIELNTTENSILEFEEIVAKLRDDIFKTKSTIASLSENIDLIDNDLKNNQDAVKLKQLGSEHNCLSSNDICPVCQQHISDSLIINLDDIEYMSIEENIKHLNAQKKMLLFAKDSRSMHLKEAEHKYRFLLEKISELRKLALIIRNDLYSVDDNYSEAMIFKKIKMQSEIERLEILKEQLDTYKSNLSNLSLEWQEYLKEKELLSKEKFTDLDTQKINKLRECFVTNLKNFGYKSVTNVESIKISSESYLPIIDNFDMKFDSSASDNIRGIWAYTLALLQVSNSLEGNHPSTIIFDEPVQHNIISKDMESFFNSIIELEDDCQIIIGITVKDTDTKNVIDKLNDEKYHKIEIYEKAFQKIQ